MKKLLLLVGLVVFYSFSCVADLATDQKVIEEYNKLKNTYPKGYATPCRYQFASDGGVEWDLHKVYYIVENNQLGISVDSDKVINVSINVSNICIQEQGSDQGEELLETCPYDF